MRMPAPNRPKKANPRIFCVPSDRRNSGSFSIEPTIKMKYTTRAKIGIVIMNQSNSVFIIYWISKFQMMLPKRRINMSVGRGKSRTGDFSN